MEARRPLNFAYHAYKLLLTFRKIRVAFQCKSGFTTLCLRDMSGLRSQFATQVCQFDRMSEMGLALS
ncbi:protein of unknown function [Pararobbsia alpina]